MQDLTEKNTHLSQELQECKAQLEAALASLIGNLSGHCPASALSPGKSYEH